MMLTQHAELPSFTEATYWLAEPQPELLEMVYQHEAEPDPYYLFARTPLAGLQEQGPVLISLSAHSSLLGYLREAPARFQGLLLITPAEPRVLLSHLQTLLEVGFDSQRKALLRYYDPVVASYFWPSIEADEAATWMSSIQQIFWYGGTWAAKAEGKLQWHELTQPQTTEASVHTRRRVLSTKQQQALINQNIEQFAFDWLQVNPSVPFPEVMARIHAGIAAGHDERTSLTAWLDNRNKYKMEQQG